MLLWLHVDFNFWYQKARDKYDDESNKAFDFSMFSSRNG